MLTRLRHIVASVRPWMTGLPRYARYGAWFFAIGSALPLLWLIFEGQGDGTSSRVFGTTVNDVSHSIWGLTYSGTAGSILLWLELIALIAATVMTVLPGRMTIIGRSMVTRARHIGHGYLTGWAALWMVGTMYLAAIDPGFWTLQAIFLTILFACTLYRTITEWSPLEESQGEMPTQSLPRFDDAPAVAPDRKVQFVSNHRAQVTPIAPPHTDADDVSRFVLHRSAVRPADRVREIVPPTDPHSRPFSSGRSRQHSIGAVDARDDYGASIRAALRRIGQVIRSTAVQAYSHARRSIGSAVVSLRKSPRSTESV